MSVEKTIEDGIGTVVLDHPPLNILTRSVLAELRERLAELGRASPAGAGEAWDEASGAGGVRVLLITAAGGHFSAGADVGEHLPPEFEEMIPEFVETVEAVYGFPMPVVAAVRGRCLGAGFELVQAADVVVAGEGAAFGQPEILLGVSPPAACALLPSLVSPSLAAEIVLTGDPIPADRARQAGLVGHVVPDDRVEEEARKLAARMARHSAAALRHTKKALRAGQATARASALRETQRIYVDELMRTDDAVEGLRAFLEKRTPEWAGR